MISLLHSGVAASLPTFPNLEFLTTGYNIVKGNPQSTGIDPGQGTQGIIQFTYETQNPPYGIMYAVPDGMNVIDAPSCAYRGSGLSYSNAQDYQASLKRQASISGSAKSPGVKFLPSGLLGASFSASASFQGKFKGGMQSGFSFTSSVSECTAYTAAWDSFGWQPAFTNDFVSAVQLMGRVPDICAVEPQLCAEVIGAFGTHYATKITMGGSSVWECQFANEAMDALVEASVDVSAAASLDFLVHVGGNISSDADFSAWQKVHAAAHSCVCHGKPQCAPAAPNGNWEDTDAWRAEIQLPDGQPTPIAYELKSIVELLVPQLWPNITRFPNISSTQLSLATYLNDTYCGTVPNCKPPAFGYACNYETWQCEQQEYGHLTKEACDAGCTRLPVNKRFDFTGQITALNWTHREPYVRCQLQANVSGYVMFLSNNTAVYYDSCRASNTVFGTSSEIEVPGNYSDLAKNFAGHYEFSLTSVDNSQYENSFLHSSLLARDKIAGSFLFSYHDYEYQHPGSGAWSYCLNWTATSSG